MFRNSDCSESLKFSSVQKFSSFHFLLSSIIRFTFWPLHFHRHHFHFFCYFFSPFYSLVVIFSTISFHTSTPSFQFFHFFTSRHFIFSLVWFHFFSSYHFRFSSSWFQFSIIFTSWHHYFFLTPIPHFHFHNIHFSTVPFQIFNFIIHFAKTSFLIFFAKNSQIHVNARTRNKTVSTVPTIYCSLHFYNNIFQQLDHFLISKYWWPTWSLPRHRKCGVEPKEIPSSSPLLRRRSPIFQKARQRRPTEPENPDTHCSPRFRHLNTAALPIRD